MEVATPLTPKAPTDSFGQGVLALFVARLAPEQVGQYVSKGLYLQPFLTDVFATSTYVGL